MIRQAVSEIGAYWQEHAPQARAAASADLTALTEQLNTIARQVGNEWQWRVWGNGADCYAAGWRMWGGPRG